MCTSYVKISSCLAGFEYSEASLYTLQCCEWAHDVVKCNS